VPARLQDVQRRATPLLKAPPSLTTPVNINVQALIAAGTTRVSGSSTTDANVIWPTTPVTQLPQDPLAEGLLTINGFRNIVSIGGHIDVPRTIATTLAAPATTSDTTVQLADATAFPIVGGLNLGGYGLTYNNKIGNTLSGVTWNSFVYANARSLPLPAGLEVWIREQSRGGLAFQDYAGTIHVEGLKVTGDIVDAFRFSTTRSGVDMRIQNCLFTPDQHHDGVNTYDGHPDCMQYAGHAGPVTLDRITGYTSGRGFINKADLGAPYAVTAIRARDVNFNGVWPGGGILWDNAYGHSTTWDITNCWGAPYSRSTFASTSASDPSNVPSKIMYGVPPGGDFVKAADIGIGYTNTVGYVT
jgi:hypothetical protein